MKNILILLILFIVGCTKENETTPSTASGQVTFYMQQTNHSWHLLVDGVDRGALEGTDHQPNCGDLDFLTLNLSVGSHTFDAKSMDGLAWGNPETVVVSQGCEVYQAR